MRRQPILRPITMDPITICFHWYGSFLIDTLLHDFLEDKIAIDHMLHNHSWQTVKTKWNTTKTVFAEDIGFSSILSNYATVSAACEVLRIYIIKKNLTH